MTYLSDCDFERAESLWNVLDMRDDRHVGEFVKDVRLHADDDHRSSLMA